MNRRRRAAALAVTALLMVCLPGCGVDRDANIEANERLAAELPTFPGRASRKRRRHD
jgi:hypothetical protein